MRQLLLALLLLMVSRGVMAEPEHALVVHFNYGSTDLSRLFALEDRLETALAKARVGEYDGKRSL